MTDFSFKPKVFGYIQLAHAWLKQEQKYLKWKYTIYKTKEFGQKKNIK